MSISRFSLATFNLYNLNLPGLPLYADRDGWSEPDHRRKIAWTASMLRQLEADIVGVQELWHADALAEAVDVAGMTGDYDVLATPATGDRITCAALVRRGMLVDEPEWISVFPDGMRLEQSREDEQTPEISVSIDGFSRPVLHFRALLDPREAPVEVFVCHLKSKAPARVWKEDWYRDDKERHRPHATALGSALSTIRRTAEATALRMILTGVMKKTDIPVILLGDVNDGQHSNTLNILTGQPRFLVGGSVGGADNALYTAQTMQQHRDTRDVYYTHVHQSQRESLDHILVSEQFYDHSRRRRWLFEGLTITNDHLNTDNHADDGTGDHGIVRVSFRHQPM